jgi:hypothetical protein
LPPSGSPVTRTSSPITSCTSQSYRYPSLITQFPRPSSLHITPNSVQHRLTQSRWVYLAFFNGLWVVIPVWLLIEAYFEMVPAVEMMDEFKKREAKRKAL